MILLVEQIAAGIATSFRAQDLPDAIRSEPILVRLGENGKLERWGN